MLTLIIIEAYLKHSRSILNHFHSNTLDPLLANLRNQTMGTDGQTDGVSSEPLELLSPTSCDDMIGKPARLYSHPFENVTT